MSSEQKTIYQVTGLKLDHYHISLQEALFHNANGYIGVRYDFEEGYPDEYHFVPSQYINGFYDFTPVNQAERLYGFVSEKQTTLNIADTQSIRLFIGEEEFSMFSGTVLASCLRLDMARGVTIREVTWRSPSGKELDLSITRMASFHQLSLFTIEYDITPLNFSGEIVIRSGHSGNVFNYADPTDPRIADEVIRHIIPQSCEIKNGASYITSTSASSGLEVCSGVKNVLWQEHQQQFTIDDHHAVFELKTTGVRGEKIKLVKYSVFCDSIRHDNIREQTEGEMRRALSVPLQQLYEKQEEYLSDYWDRCRVEIEGDPVSNTSIRYNLYQLIQAVGKDSHCNIAPKGLSGDGYEGQYFWDSEMYIQPFFTITNPSLTRNLLEYRYGTLELARENARILGHRQGALYPWRTITGRECSGYFPSGSAQYHINGDIAYAVIAYYLATKDLAFMREKGAEILWETARLWMDVGNFHQGKFHINDVTGPDEYTCIVNNNYYTNAIAQYNLYWAVKMYRLLRSDEDAQELIQRLNLQENEILGFQNAADNMYLPYDEKLNINPQDDSFLQKKKWDLAEIPQTNFPLLLHYHPLHLYRHQICKQADTVMAHFILEDLQSFETMCKSFQYYETITTHDSSLSYCIFSIMAARLGMEEKAFAYYELTAQLDLVDRQRNTEDGVHVANMGGNYLAIVYGFGGFRLKEQGVSIAPILPKAWTGYCFKFVFEGSRVTVHVDRDYCTLALESGDPIDLNVYGTLYNVKDALQIERHSSGQCDSCQSGGSI